MPSKHPAGTRVRITSTGTTGTVIRVDRRDPNAAYIRLDDEPSGFPYNQYTLYADHEFGVI